MSNHDLLVSVNDHLVMSDSLYTDSSLLRKKAHDYAEETRAMLLKGIAKKEITKPIDRRQSAIQVSYRQKSLALPKHKVPSPIRLPSIIKSDQTLVGTTESIRNKAVMFDGQINPNQFADSDNQFAHSDSMVTRSLYELDGKHCDHVQSILDGSDPDISMSMDRFRKPSNEKKYSPKMKSSILFYTSSQKTPVILPSIDRCLSLDRRADGNWVAIPTIDEFDRNSFNFFKDLSRLCEYEHIHQQNIMSSITRGLNAIHTENVGSITDDELLQMIYNLMMHVDGKILVNDVITKDMWGVFENLYGSCGNRELALQLKVCAQKISKSEYIDLKAIIGHIRRIAVVYGYYKSVGGLSSLFSEFIFSTEKSNDDYMHLSPIQLNEIIFKKNGPQTQLSAILELILYYYNIIF